MLAYFVISAMAITIAGGVNEGILPTDGSAPDFSKVEKTELDYSLLNG